VMAAGIVEVASSPRLTATDYIERNVNAFDEALANQDYVGAGAVSGRVAVDISGGVTGVAGFARGTARWLSGAEHMFDAARTASHLDFDASDLSAQMFGDAAAGARARKLIVEVADGSTEGLVQEIIPAVPAMPLSACFGSSTCSNYRETFFAQNPSLRGSVVIHHAVEQQIISNYPSVVTLSEIHSLENLRGIPKSINSNLHLSQIRRVWNKFYRENQTPTKAEFLEKATEIDDMFGTQFDPPVR